MVVDDEEMPRLIVLSLSTQSKIMNWLLLAFLLSIEIEGTTSVLSVFGVTERSVRPRMPRPIYLYHPVRMTDGGFRDTYTIRTDGYFFCSFWYKTHP